MTPATLLLLATAIVLTLGSLIVGLIWWMHRPVAVSRISDDPLPLFSTSARAASRERPASVTMASGNGAGHNVPLIEGDIVRFAQPSDRSLLWLPGSLEILNGPDVGRAIHFVHVPNAEDDVISFGRTTAPSYHHVQLRDGLVNRQHASLRHEQGHWCIINLSEERPVLHNEMALPVGEAQRLHDGDRLTMGATLFQYRA